MVEEDAKKLLEKTDRAKRILEDAANPAGMKAIQERMKSFTSFPLESYRLPEIEMPKFPTAEEIQEYASAQRLVEQMHARYKAWLKKLPKDAQPVIVALLPSGTALRVSHMRAEGHHGICITGFVGNKSGTECLLLVNQHQLQLLCYIEKLEEPEERRPIGFHGD